MAKQQLNLSDPLTTLRTKFNQLSDDLGDLRLMSNGSGTPITNDSSAVGIMIWLKDNAGISLSSISVTDAGGDGSLAYNNSTGVITYTGPSTAEVLNHFADDSANCIVLDSSSGKFGVLDATITSSKFSSATSLVIKDASGSTVKTIYSPGS